MLTDLARDAAFTAAWFGLMTMVWCGWAQEDPPRRLRPWLGAASVAGALLACGCGYLVARRWDTASALDGRYHWFGVLVAVEVLVAGAGCLVLARRGAARWFAWWVALVVALHFLPLAALLDDLGVAVVGGVLTVALVALVPRLRRSQGTTSAVVGSVTGGVLLLSGLLAAVVALRLG